MALLIRLFCGLVALPACAIGDQLEFDTTVRFAVQTEEDVHLGIQYDNTRSATTGLLRQAVLWQPADTWLLHGLAELFTTSRREISLEEEFGEVVDRDYFYLREFWVDYSGIGRYPGEFVRLGVERRQEPSRLWWDREIANLRWNLDTTLVNASAAFGRRVKFNHSDEEFLDEAETRQDWWVAHLDYQWAYHNWLGVKVLHVRDSDEDRNPAEVTDKRFAKKITWLGLSAQNGYFTHRLGSWQYALDIMAMSGETHFYDVKGLAADFGLRKNFFWRNAFSIGMHLGYAEGGEGADDRVFFQSGLQTNRSRFAGTRAVLSRFGEAAKGELSNLTAGSLYLSQSVGLFWEWALVLHDLQRADTHSPVYFRGVMANPISDQRKLGRELDLAVAYFGPGGEGPKRWDHNASVRVYGGYFQAGAAYDNMPADGRYRLLIDFQKRF